MQSGPTLAAISIAYFLIFFLLLRGKKGKEVQVKALGVFAAWAWVFSLGHLVPVQPWWPTPAAPPSALFPASLLLTALLFYHLTRVFLRQPKLPTWFWFSSVIVLGLAWAGHLMPLLITIPEINTQTLLTTSANTLGAAAWLGMMLRIIIEIIRNYREIRQPLLRNRINYWSLALILLLSSGAAVYIQQFQVAIWLQLGAVSLAAFTVLTHRPPNLRSGSLQILGFIAVTLLLILIYTLLYLIVQYFLQVQAGLSPILAGAAMALILAIVLRPLVHQVQTSIYQSLSGSDVDTSAAIREYSNSISNILNLELLATVVLGLISESLENQRGTLFLVDRVEIENNRLEYHLRSARSAMGTARTQVYTLPAGDPITQYLSTEHAPLSQYDIEYQDRFLNAASIIVEWFSKLRMDVYVPIYSQGNWIGLLAIGPKTSGLPYSNEDLRLLSTLADQTAVALENARLVEGLVRVNTELEMAYSNLEKANQELARLDKAKSDFISITSHELRTPITVIQGYAQMLLEDPAISGNSFHQKLLTGIANGTTRIHTIVENMLDVAKLDNQEFEIYPQPCQLNHLVDSVISQFRGDLQIRNLALATRDLENLSPIEADFEALFKVFSNLLSNAIKFTPDGGEIEISGEERNTKPNGEPFAGVEIIVRDSGIGIDPEHHTLIFEKFYQLGETGLHSSGHTKFKGAGPGLGLAIARGIILGHHGEIWVESKGCDEETLPGSSFHVLLPYQQPGSAVQG